MPLITVDIIRSDEAFQAALQRYAHANGSSDGVAAAALRALQPVFTAHNKRVTELLETNNRYLNEARCARDDLKSLKERILGYRE